ncbi:putative WRKY transcription factor 53 [Zea mays]|uniref:Putative WRKY transcription factor 53 n=1 Tax=Zea mays TaxID=4577 RepID=A0A3L6DA88_MAIZE|nr:putative WRKY transcription factor 53 [Zea mays]
MQDGAGAEAEEGGIQTLLALLADGEEQARQLGEMVAAEDDGPWSSSRRAAAEHYRGAARRLQRTLGRAAAVARAFEAAAPGSSRGTDRSDDSPRSADESSGRTVAVDAQAQERQSTMCKRRKGLPRWTAKFRVPEASLEATPDDGFSWRKYGQKDILGAKFPRGYYRCTYRAAQACAATKQVQRSDADLCVFDVTYQGEHTCHQKQRRATAALSAPGGRSQQSPPPALPLEQQDPGMRLLGMGFRCVLRVETAGLALHDDPDDRGPASAPAAPFSFPSVPPPLLHAGEAATTTTDSILVAAAFSPPASSYGFSAPSYDCAPATCYGDVYDYDYEAPQGARMRGAESSELGEVVSRAMVAAPASFDYSSSLFHHQAELDPHLPFPPFGGPPHDPYQ